MDLEFRHLVTLEERLTVFPLYHQLNPKLSEEKFNQRMNQIMQEPGYHLLAIFSTNKLIAISGYWISHKLYSGKYLEPDNVVVDENYRSQRVGEALQTELENIARKNQCNAMMLDAYLHNLAGHKFYERHGYKKEGYHFVKKLASS